MDKKELLDFIDSRIKYNHEQGIKYQNAECELVLTREEIEKELEGVEQIKWERDIAIQQLNELGYQFGEKIKPDEHKTVKELRAECEEYLDTDLSPEKRCKTVREMTPKEWLEEIIYAYGNGSAKPNRIYIFVRICLFY